MEARRRVLVLDKLQELYNKLHESGIKLLYLRDPKTKEPSVTLTLFVISFNIYVFTLVNKLGKWFSDVDGASQLFIACGCFYLGRSITKGTTKSEVEE